MKGSFERTTRRKEGRPCYYAFPFPVVAYQLALGGSFAASESLNIDLQYRFFGTADPDFEGLEAEYSTHNFMVGLRHAF